MQFQLTKEFLEQLNNAVAENAEKEVMRLVNELHPVDVAEILDEQNLEQAQAFFNFLPKEFAADVLVELDEERREKFLEALSSQEIAEHFIDNMDSDDAADIIGELSEEKRGEVIAHIEDLEQASDILKLLDYHGDTAGGLMTNELISVNWNWDINTCLKELKKQAEELERVYTVYVVDDNNVLKGRISLRRLLLTPGTKKVIDIYESDILSVTPDVDDEHVAMLMDKYDLVSIPVVDELNRLIGRITIDDVVDVIKEEAEKDYQLASGISENIESSDKFWIISRARLPWLLVGLLGGIVGSKIIGIYEGEIQLHPEMAFFIPLIAAMGGNVGVQSSALIVQGLANKSMGLTGIWSKLGKEMLVGIMNGLVCSILIFGYTFFFQESLNLAVTVSTALLSVIFFAGIFGTLIPLLLHKYKIDPALATGPFITTTNDIFGIFIYFFIGYLMYA
ncbi:MAG: magnesium transporter [Vicingaceae bacterium]|nr:magnesium transporter [Vicingaceae bacterium]